MTNVVFYQLKYLIKINCHHLSENKSIIISKLIDNRTGYCYI